MLEEGTVSQDRGTGHSGSRVENSSVHSLYRTLLNNELIGFSCLFKRKWGNEKEIQGNIM